MEQVEKNPLLGCLIIRVGFGAIFFLGGGNQDDISNFAILHLYTEYTRERMP